MLKAPTNKKEEFIKAADEYAFTDKFLKSTSEFKSILVKCAKEGNIARHEVWDILENIDKSK